MIKRNLQYLFYLLKHKYYVARECWKLGLIWQGIIHDWQKFLPCEWIPYAQTFYGTGEDHPGFNAAWLHHQHYGPHHWQHWLLHEDSGKTITLEMPWKYCQEMLADWRGMSFTLFGADNGRTTAWYLANRKLIRLHPNTRLWIEGQLGLQLEPLNTEFQVKGTL